VYVFFRGGRVNEITATLCSLTHIRQCVFFVVRAEMFLSAKPAAQVFLAAGQGRFESLSIPSLWVRSLRIINAHDENSTVYMRRCTQPHPHNISNVALSFNPLIVHMGQVSNLTVHIRGLAPAASYLLKTEVSTLISGDDSMIAPMSSIYLDPLDLSLRGSPHLDPLSRKFAYTYHDFKSDAFWKEGLSANVRVSLNFSVLSFIPHQLHVSIFDASPAVPEEDKMLDALSREITYHDMLQQRIIVEDNISTSAPAESSCTHGVHHQRTNSTAAQGESSYTHASRESRAYTFIRDFAEYCGDLQNTVAPGAEQTAVDMPDMFNVPLDKIDINYFLQPVFELFGCGVPGLDIESTSGLIVLPRHITRLKIDVGLAFNAPNSQIWLDRPPPLSDRVSESEDAGLGVFAFEPNRQVSVFTVCLLEYVLVLCIQTCMYV
jgi:hypothetical protein